MRAILHSILRDRGHSVALTTTPIDCTQQELLRLQQWADARNVQHERLPGIHPILYVVEVPGAPG